MAKVMMKASQKSLKKAQHVSLFQVYCQKTSGEYMPLIPFPMPLRTGHLRRATVKLSAHSQVSEMLFIQLLSKFTFSFCGHTRSRPTGLKKGRDQDNILIMIN